MVCESSPGASALAQVTTAESIYADLSDASSILSAIDSGLFVEYGGQNRAAWSSEVEGRRAQLASALARIDERGLPPAERRVLGILREKLAAFIEESSSKGGKTAHCADAGRKDLGAPALRAALEACFTEIANGLEFEGARIDRVSALGKLAELDTPKRRKALFLAFEPLWSAINGKNEADSPYRRLIALTSAEARKSVPRLDATIPASGRAPPSDASAPTPPTIAALDAAARTLGVTSADAESWLVSILEAWAEATKGKVVEPWDYRFLNSAADRALSKHIALSDMLTIDHRYYRDLGADLDALGVLYDLLPREGKSSVAYTDFFVHGRWNTAGRWQPTIARVLATYSSGSLGSLNELVHENGHAVHISAIRNRPAYVDWNDDLFVEAFADVSSWSLYEPAWQRRYLGHEAPEADSMRGLFGNVMLDVACALFEVRMLRTPDTDPNALWTDITHRYLHIAPHPELSWWAVRGQLVELPGYMVNYGLGAALTADLRARIRGEIGPYDAGNASWYSEVSRALLQFGSERETSQLLRQFLGRPVSISALLTQIARARQR